MVADEVKLAGLISRGMGGEGLAAEVATKETYVCWMGGAAE